jgi:hypothetical protein
MGYVVIYNAPAGHTVRRSMTTTVPNLRAARAYIRGQIGGRSFGRWTDEDGRECWHESRKPGCGGYCIERDA